MSERLSEDMYFSDISSVILSDKFSDTLLEVRHATLNSQDRGWGPARHTELTGSRLRSGTPHWTHSIAVEVRHATLNSQDRSWGPARHTELTGSRFGVRHATLNSQDRGWGPARHTELTSSRLVSGTPHWTHELAVEVRQATLNSQDRGWGPAHHMDATDRQRDAEGGEWRGGGGGGRGEGEGEVTHIKSNNPHLTGGEKWTWQRHASLCLKINACEWRKEWLSLLWFLRFSIENGGSVEQLMQLPLQMRKDAVPAGLWKISFVHSMRSCSFWNLQCYSTPFHTLNAHGFLSKLFVQ